MAYVWTPNTPEYHDQIGQFTISNGSMTLDVDIQNAGEGWSEAGYATIMGQIVDALEGAGLTLGAIRLMGSASKTLTEV
ncbi:hypothetical protein [Nonomuraea sp. NPDC050643]|uniref:hypothetical protein n=1 Tax=Nonomuraea sp. NPDC050643 TaxID=3155660 RepID=UPI0033DEED7C